MFARMAASFDEGGIESSDPESIRVTAKRMRAQINELIQGCSMTGEAHDRLHTYLMMYIPAVDRMADGGTKAEADSVGRLLELYPTYFE